MTGGWANSNRRARLPSDWAQLRVAVQQRADGRCEGRAGGHRCPNPGSECDHIRAGDDHTLANLQWLCTSCHRAKTTREATQARTARRHQQRRPREAHPGQRTPGAH